MVNVRLFDQPDDARSATDEAENSQTRGVAVGKMKRITGCHKAGILGNFRLVQVGDCAGISDREGDDLTFFVLASLVGSVELNGQPVGVSGLGPCLRQFEGRLRTPVQYREEEEQHHADRDSSGVSEAPSERGCRNTPLLQARIAHVQIGHPGFPNSYFLP